MSNCLKWEKILFETTIFYIRENSEHFKNKPFEKIRTAICPRDKNNKKAKILSYKYDGNALFIVKYTGMYL